MAAHKAALSGDVLGLEAWLSSHDNPNLISESLHHRTILHCASYSGSLPCVEALLRYKSIDLNKQDRLGLTPLQCASFKNHLDVVKALISAGADVNMVDKDHSTALHKACQEGFKDVVEALLLAPNCNPNQGDAHSLTPLHIATERGHAAIVQVLVRHGANPNMQDVDGQTPLHVATYHIHPKTVRYLLKKSASPTLADVEGATPLHLAAWVGNKELVEMLIDVMPNINLRDVDGATPLSIASEQGNLDCVLEMLQHPSIDLRPDHLGETPIHKAALSNRLEVLSALLLHDWKSTTATTTYKPAGYTEEEDSSKSPKSKLKTSTDVNGEVTSTNTTDERHPLSHARHHNNLSNSSAVLIDYQLPTKPWGIDSPDIREATALLVASFNGNLSCVSLLLEHGASVVHQDEEGATALHKAAFNGHTDIMELLLIKKSDIDRPDVSGASPLHKAAFNGQTNAVLMLCKCGAKVNAVDSQGGTPLHNAAYGGHLDAVNALLRFMPNSQSISAADSDGFNALHMASSQGHDHIVSTLIQHKDSPFAIDAVTQGGWTALILALKQNHVSTALTLIRLGAKFNLDKELSRKLRNVPQAILQQVKQEYAIVSSGGKASPSPREAPKDNVPTSTIARRSSFITNASNSSIPSLSSKESGKSKRKTDKSKALLDGTSSGYSTDSTVTTSTESFASNSSSGLTPFVRSPSKEAANQSSESSSKKESKRRSSTKQHPPTERDYATDTGGSHHSTSSSGIPNPSLIVISTNPGEMDRSGSPTFGIPSHKKASRRGSASADPAGRRAAASAKDNNGKSADNSPDATPPQAFKTKGGRNHTGSLFVSSKGSSRPKVDDDTYRAESNPTSSTTPPMLGQAFQNQSSPNLTSSAGANHSPPSAFGNLSPSPSSYDMTRSNRPRKSTFKRGNEPTEVVQAIELFKKNPGDAIELLIESEVLEDNCSAVARWIFERDDLDKAQLGLFLGREKAWNMAILESFVELFDFADMEFDMALRRYLSKFRLPGEAQKIDKLMEKFAARYFFQNPNQQVFADKDAVYVLAFSVIMLNTDAHNPAIKKANKMTRAQFIRNTQGINAGSDFPDKFLTDLYEKIVMYEIKMESDESEFTNAELKGWLMKQGGKVKSWKKRWFVLDGNCLFYFSSSTDKDPTGIIPLENLQVQAIVSKRRHAFELRSPNEGPIKATVRKGSQMVVGNHEQYVFQAANDQEMQLWIDSLNRNIFRNPFYLLLAAKKKQMESRNATSASTPTAAKSPKTPSSSTISNSNHHSSSSKSSSHPSTTEHVSNSQSKKTSTSTSTNVRISMDDKSTSSHQTASTSSGEHTGKETPPATGSGLMKTSQSSSSNRKALNIDTPSTKDGTDSSS